MAKKLLTGVCAFLLILLFTYSAVVKLMDFNGFKADMGRQPLPPWLQQSLIVLLPVTELGAAILLLTPKCKRTGFYVSAGIMVLFTAYVSLVLFGAFKDVPCSCGGLIHHLSWRQHMVFNLFFLAAAVTGICTTNKSFIAIKQVPSRTSCQNQ